MLHSHSHSHSHHNPLLLPPQQQPPPPHSPSPPPPAPSNPDKEQAAATKIQAAFRSHRTNKALASLAASPSQLWSTALQNARIALLHEHNATWTAAQTLPSAPNSPTTTTTRAIWKRGALLTSILGKGSAGISSDKSLTLLTEHWLESSDGLHRYGSNLKPYHELWVQSGTPQPFFYWLDHGDGRDVDLEREGRSRERLMKERVRYLDEVERRAYEVTVNDGLLIYKESGDPVHTLPPTTTSSSSGDILPDSDPNDTEEERLRKKRLRNAYKHIYILSPTSQLYIARKQKGQFHHSSFLNGGTVCAAGGIVVDRGRLRKINTKSGHYRPGKINVGEVVGVLTGWGVNMEGVVVSNPFDQEGDGDNGHGHDSPSVAGVSPTREEGDGIEGLCI